MEKYSGLAMDTAGNTLAGADVTVYLAGTATLASLFSDNVFTPKANPSTADVDGTYFFYSHGRFDIVVTKDGFTFRPSQTSDLFLYDPMAVLSFTAGAAQDNYAPLNGAYVSTWRLTASAPFTLTGIEAGFAGQVLTLVNVSASNTITLANESASSTAANRLATGGGDYTLTAGQTVILSYDAASARWRTIGMTAATTTTVTTGALGLYGSRSLTGVNNAATPTTKYDLAADLVVTRRAVDGTTIVHPTVAVTVDLTVDGPAANGRDQVGSFTADSWVYLYWIGKADGTIAGIASAVPPPTGPTLPVTFTHWAFATAIRFNSSSQILGSYLRDYTVYYTTLGALVTTQTGTTETAVDVASWVPPIAMAYTVHGKLSGVNVASVASLRVVTGSTTMAAIAIDGTAGNTGMTSILSVTLPNVGQQFFYDIDNTTGTGSLTLTFQSYQVSNGAA